MKMNSILLSRKDISFLKENLIINDIYNINEGFTTECIHEILNKLSDLLVEKGLKENDEPNELGIKIERLIDIFNEKLYK